MGRVFLLLFLFCFVLVLLQEPLVLLLPAASFLNWKVRAEESPPLPSASGSVSGILFHGLFRKAPASGSGDEWTGTVSKKDSTAWEALARYLVGLHNKS